MAPVTSFNRRPTMKNLLAAFLTSILLSACMTARAHAHANTATNRVSNAGVYALTYEPAVLPIPKRQLHAWTIELRRGNGHPVDGAHLRIGCGMPGPGH